MTKSDIQCNILKGHGRNFSKLIFIKFKDGELRNGLINLLGHYPINSAQDQDDQSLIYKKTGENNDLLAGLYLSANCYNKLQNEEITTPQHDTFKAGIKGLNKQGVEKYDENHIMLLLACDDLGVLNAATDDIQNNYEAIEDVIIEHGKVFRRNKQPIEHFGFYDGLVKSQYETIQEAQPILEGMGSYLAFLKYEQDVREFNRLTKNLSLHFEFPSDFMEAQVMGVYKEKGYPVSKGKSYFTKGIYYLRKYGARKFISKLGYRNYRNFDHATMDYANDPQGKKCPFHSHTRKMNPRDGKDNGIIARRGMTYDYQPKGRAFDVESGTFADEPHGDVGIHFMAFQNNITDHLLKMMNRANNQDGTGIDPIIGESQEGDVIPQDWNQGWGSDKPTIRRVFSGVTTLKAGGFFHAPSMETINKLTLIV